MQSCFIHIFHSVPTFFGGEVVESQKTTTLRISLHFHIQRVFNIKTEIKRHEELSFLNYVGRHFSSIIFLKTKLLQTISNLYC